MKLASSKHVLASVSIGPGVKLEHSLDGSERPEAEKGRLRTANGCGYPLERLPFARVFLNFPALESVSFGAMFEKGVGVGVGGVPVGPVT